MAGLRDVFVSRANPVDSRYYLALVGGTGWLIGIWLASIAGLSLTYWFIMALAATAAAIVTWRNGRAGLVLAGIAALSWGAGRYVFAQPVTDPGHIHYYNGTTNTILTAEVVAEPLKYDTFQQLRLDVEEVLVTGQTQATPVSGSLLVQTNRFADIPYGATVRLIGDLQSLETLGSPGYANYLRRQGIMSVVSYPAIKLLNADEDRSLYRILLTFRERSREVIRRTLAEPQAALLNGILLGDDSGMSRETIEAFRTTGMTHIIAISGFNIALLIVLLDRLSAPFLPRRLAALVIMAFVIVYSILVGGAASVIRAAVMGIAYLFAMRMLGRPAWAIASLLVASFLMTLTNPMTLWDIGFQLSFAATLGLVLFAGSWSSWTRQRLAAGSDSPTRWASAKVIADVLVVTLAAQVLTLPLILFHFGRLSLVSLPANILVLPVQPAVMATGGATLLLGLLSKPLGQLAGYLTWPFLAYTIAVIRSLSQLPNASAPLQLAPSVVIVIYLAIAGLTGLAMIIKRSSALPRQTSRTVAIPIGLAALVVIGIVMTYLSAAHRPDGRLHVAFLDVGQGDATFIRTPEGNQILIDGGRFPSLLLEELGRQMPFWDRSIDLVFATHPDDDHIAGLVEVVDRYQVSQLLTNGTTDGDVPVLEALLTMAASRATPVHAAQAGEILQLEDGILVEVLHPNPGFHSDSQNETSLVIRITYGQHSIMLPGDAEADAEAELLKQKENLASTVLKAGHHGANTSSTTSFLEAVRPQIIIVSAGEDNSYGHPHPAMLARAATIGAAVLRTDELGTIEMMSDGLQMWWQSSD